MSEPQITVMAAHMFDPGSNTDPTRVVIHSTCPDAGAAPAASAPGTAHGTALYFALQSSGGSAHYIEGVDREEHCVPDNRAAWQAPPNPNSLGIEITSDGGNPGVFRNSSGYSRADWLSPQVWPAVVRAAGRARELCDRFGIPKRRISTSDLLNGARGICGHVDVSNAWHQSDHSDPGPNFPWAEFMAEVTGGHATSSSPAPKVGSVQALQAALGVTADGQWGPATDRAAQVVHYAAHGGTYPWGVKALQAVLGVTQDGQVGPATEAALTGAVKAVQAALGVTADGAWGPTTDAKYNASRHTNKR